MQGPDDKDAWITVPTKGILREQTTPTRRAKAMLKPVLCCLLQHADVRLLLKQHANV